MFQTEFEFTLPVGYVDSSGTLHRTGVMRLCTALDELEAMHDPRAKRNVQYVSVVLLSRVIERLGELTEVTPEVVERLFSADFTYLQHLFVRLNDATPPVVETQCPRCGTRFSLDFRGAESASEVT